MASVTCSLAAIMQLSGAVGAAIVDLETGRTLGQAGGGMLSLEAAAAGNTQVVREKLHTISELGLHDEIDDILITLGTQYHIIRPLKTEGVVSLFVYVALDKKAANLGIARHKISEITSTLSI